jgi:tRNA modification GTPase
VQSAADTIVAVATPPGRGGIGVVRLSGGRAAEIGGRLAARTAPWRARHATRVHLAADACRADAVVTYFAAPASYTGEDVLEIAVHGNPLLLACVVDCAVALGARVAGPGEFTLRAFVHGKLDLVQAEAVRDLVDAVSPAQVRAAARQVAGTLSAAIQQVAEELRRLETLLEASVDFPEEGYRFIEPATVTTRLAAVAARVRGLVAGDEAATLVRDGATVVVAGAPNVGKSSLFNALLGTDRAIVTPVPGTTRDLVSERVLLEGHLVRLIDSAGLRDTSDAVEAEGIRRAAAAAGSADVVVLVFDGSRPLDADDRAALAAADPARTVIVVNKSDLPPAWAGGAVDPGGDVAIVSARTGEGIAALARRLALRLARVDTGGEDVLVTNRRQRGLLGTALDCVQHALDETQARGGALPEEFVLADVRGALEALEDVTGRRSRDDVLAEIFATFCIGK